MYETTIDMKFHQKMTLGILPWFQGKPKNNRANRVNRLNFKATLAWISKFKL